MPAPLTNEQRLAILRLLGDGVETQAIATSVGVTPGQVVSVKAHLTMGTYGEVDAEVEVADAIDAAFGLERDLQIALRANIQQLDPTLTVIDGGKEQTVSSGRIDIMAKDSNGRIVVIELKAGDADREAVAQILSYIGDLMGSNADVRGVLLARDFSPRARSAARAANIQLVKYGFKFSFNTVLDKP